MSQIGWSNELRETLSRVAKDNPVPGMKNEEVITDDSPEHDVPSCTFVTWSFTCDAGTPAVLRLNFIVLEPVGTYTVDDTSTALAELRRENVKWLPVQWA